MRRRSSIMALSTPNLTDTVIQDQETARLPRTRSIPILHSQRVDPIVSPGPRFQFPRDRESLESSPLSEPSTSTGRLAGTSPKRKRHYDGVYRTNEPLPGKPLIEFEDKVWDLDDEYNQANERSRRLLDEQYNDNVRRSAARYYENAPLRYGSSRVQADLV